MIDGPLNTPSQLRPNEAKVTRPVATFDEPLGAARMA
jgi:hypothetical protein